MATEALLAEALATLEEVQVYLGSDVSDTARNELFTRLINYATGQIEMECARRLKSRAYTALIVDGTGEHELDADEYPVTAVTGITETYSDGTVYRTLDISGVRLDAGGLVYLPNDVLAEGTQNHSIAGTAGIVPGTAQWKALTGIALRWIQVMVIDKDTGAGRNTSITVDGQTQSFDYRMPQDIKDALRPFKRIL